jgi:hypothetical protein
MKIGMMICLYLGNIQKQVNILTKITEFIKNDILINRILDTNLVSFYHLENK